MNRISCICLVLVLTVTNARAGGVRVNNQTGVITLPDGTLLGNGTITINSIEASDPQATVTVNNTLSVSQKVNVQNIQIQGNAINTAVDNPRRPRRGAPC